MYTEDENGGTYTPSRNWNGDTIYYEFSPRVISCLPPGENITVEDSSPVMVVLKDFELCIYPDGTVERFVNGDFDTEVISPDE